MLKRCLPIIAVVLVANAAALAVVASNGRGGPEASLRLTERELRLPIMGGDSTGMTLWLRASEGAATQWLDRAKLATLGFDCSVDPQAPDAEKHYRDPGVLPRRAYVVLEYQPGKAVEGEYGSRLRPIDVGLEPRALRAKYPERHRYIVTSGVIRPIWFRSPPAGRPTLSGRLVSILPSEIYVPQNVQQTILAALGGHGNREHPTRPLPHAPRYEVTVEYGSRLLPRVVAVRGLSEKSEGPTVR